MITATGWDSKSAGWMRFEAKPQTIGPQSPDGSRVVVNSEVLSPSGTLVGYPFHLGLWADDNRHVCSVRAPDGGPPGSHERQVTPNEVVGLPSPAWLFLWVPGGDVKRVVQVGSFSDHGNIDVRACSLESDRVVIEQNFVAQATDVTVYTLSTGRLLFHYRPATQVMDVVASHDGRLVAENDLGCNGARIRQFPANRVVGTVAGTFVSAFSWDGSTVATSTGLSIFAAVSDWKSGHVLWKRAQYSVSFVRPGQQDFLFEPFHFGPLTSSGPPLLIARADGHASLVGWDWVAAGGGDISTSSGYNPRPASSC